MKKIRLTESDLEKIVKKIIMESDVKYTDLVSFVEHLYNQGVDDYRELINRTMDEFTDKLEDSDLKEWVFDAVNKVIDDKRKPIFQEEKNPCWDGYEMVGMKKKGGKEVPNCVPKNEGVSEGLQYHIDNKIPLTESVYRYGSESFFNLINEVRDLYENDEISLSEINKEVINSDIGKKGIYEGEEVYLDFPMNESENKAVNSPKKSGSQNYVYVKGCLKDKSKVKKLTYGSSMPDKLKDPKARKAYSARHGCEGLTLSKDKCTKKYWACRKPKDFAGINAWW